MKKLYKYIVLVIGILAFSACADEELVGSFGETGKKVTLNLKVQTQDIKDVVVSRADDPTPADENKLFDLHIYVFNANSGELTGYKMIDFGNNGNVHNTEPTTYEVTVDTESGDSYIYAVANINVDDTYKLETKSSLLDPTNSTTPLKLEDFLAIKFTRESSEQGENLSPTPGNNRFMMSGYLQQGNKVNIPENGNLSDNVIKLYRILAKNTLNITSEKYTIGVNNGKFAFTPSSYRLLNVPEWGTLVPKANINDVNDYSTDNITIIEEKTKEGKTITHIESGYRKYTTDTEFVFYYPENLQNAKEGASITLWKDREKNSYNNGNKVFDNAGDYASYIEIEGKYVSEDGKTTADVTYTIHLGDFSRPTEDDNGVITNPWASMSNFKVIRNSHYIYNVHIAGVDDIRVEAQRLVDGNDKITPIDNPYAEGLIIDATMGQHYDVDAHYETRVMTFTKADIEYLRGKEGSAKTNGPGYILNIKTPFGYTIDPLLDDNEKFNTVNVKDDGIYNMQDDKICDIDEAAEVFAGTADYTWVKFVRNGAPQIDLEEGVNKGKDKTGTTNVVYGNASTHICKYPGDEHVYSSNGITGGWMNVFQLLAELYKYETYANGNPTYTCFIDENYYANKQWSQYVSWHDATSGDPKAGQKEPRTMLIANHLDISTDEKSLYAQVKYSISQRPISSVYSDPNRDAFGTEIIDEEDVYNNRLGVYNANSATHLQYYTKVPIARKTEDGSGGIPSTITDYDDNWDAFTCAYYTSQMDGFEQNWYETDDDDVKWVAGIQPLYKSVAKACMRRNRDLDGDGLITPSDDPAKNEVRWYLAAIDQYRALFYAQGVLNPDAHFINDEEMNEINAEPWGWGDTNGHDFRGSYHYWTCSDETTSATFWPEEGLTNNPTTDHTQGNWTSRAEMVRCIRTLESNGYGADNPDVFYDFNESDYTFTLDGITVSRGKSNGQLIQHHERDERTNDFSKKFKVAQEDLVGPISVQNQRTMTTAYVTGPNPDPCENYTEDGATWRTPNQKEMALMLSKKVELNILDKTGTGWNQTVYNYLTRTQYSGTWHRSPGFGCEGGSINLTPHTSGNDRIRCVRDVDPTVIVNNQ